MKTKIAFFLSTLSLGIYGCEVIKMDPEPNRSGLADWTNATHGNNVEPNYEVVFPQNRINTLEITLSKATWDSLLTQISTFSPSDSSFGGGFPVDGGAIPVGGGIPGGGGAIPVGGGGVPPAPVKSGNPVPSDNNRKFQWGESTVKFNSKEWYKVGFRFKGKTSIIGSFVNGALKLPFKLQFDEFEDRYPAIKNQRFFGFQELSFASGAFDETYIKDKLVSDLFREAGVPTARTSFCKVFINTGDGPKYYGIYTMIEVIEDSMVKSQFSDSDGNIYKPLSTLSSFNEDELRKRNNKQNPNYSDIKAFIDVLNDPNRTKNREAWRTKLEKIFDVDVFLKYLAVNNTIVNWDTYPNNYYLYFSNRTGKCTFIPWDFNLSLNSPFADQSIIDDNGNVIFKDGLELHNSQDDLKILTKSMADDPIYLQKYREYVKSFSQNYFLPNRINGIIDSHVNLISNAVSQEVWPYSSFKSNNFNGAVNELKKHILTRNDKVNKFLNKK